MEVDGDEQGAAVKEEALKADSVVVLLSQALQAQDRALLERCCLPTQRSPTSFASSIGQSHSMHLWPELRLKSLCWYDEQHLKMATQQVSGCLSI